MTVCFESCPAEIVDNILQHLDATDVGSLRLTSRSLRWKATQAHFKSHFHSKHVDLTGPALKEFNALTQPGWLGCEIRDLTLVGVVNNTFALEAFLNGKPMTREKESRAKQDLEVLRERRQDYQQLLESGEMVRSLSGAFENIAVNSGHGKLRSLSLEVIVYREDSEQRLPPLAGGGWKLIWKAAAETFQVVFAALQASRLKVDSLNIFNSRELQRCSLACNELSGVYYHNKELFATLASLNSLSISVSQRIIDLSSRDSQLAGDQADRFDWTERVYYRDLDEVAGEVQDERNFTGLANLIHVCTELERLEIHQYLTTSRRINQITIPNDRLFQRIAELERLPALKHCSLRGVFVREQDLLSFIKRVDLLRLSMEYVEMTCGTFQSIFDHCTSDGAKMQFLRVRQLWMGGHLLRFHGDGQTGLPSSFDEGGSSKLKREGQRMKDSISYHFDDNGPPFPLDNPGSRQQRVRHRQDFGPP